MAMHPNRRPSAGRVCGFFFPAIFAAHLSVSATAAFGAERPGLDTPAPRLSGTITGSPDLLRALIEFEDGNSRSFRVGDDIEGWGLITAIEEGRIRLQTPDREDTVSISRGQPLVAAMAPDATSIAPSSPVRVKVTPDLLSELDRLADDPGSVGDDLNRLLAPLVQIPVTEHILAVNGSPLADDASTAQMIRDEIEKGNVVSLRVSDGDRARSVYIGKQIEDTGLEAGE